MNGIDNLFDEKLSVHTVEPSKEAWRKLESALSKKNNSLLWLRWAAVLLLGVSLLGGYWLNRPEPVKTITQKVDTKPTRPALKKEAPSTPLLVAPKSIRTISKQVKPQTVKEDKPVENSGSEPLVTVTEAPITDVAPTIELAVVAQESKPITLTYTLEPIPLPEEDKADKKSSISKVMTFATTLKQSDPIGEFRVMKEELLAIDLKKKSNKKN